MAGKPAFGVVAPMVEREPEELRVTGSSPVDPTMNKDEIVKAIQAMKFKVSKGDIKRVINVFMNTIIDTVSKGDKVIIKNFGTFTLRKRKERVGRNPKTNQQVIIPEHYVLVFQPSKNLKF
jgi:nucleoid DNA-binding protein